MSKTTKKSPIKSDILLRVRMLYLLFVVVGVVVFLRLVYVQFFSREVDVNAERLEARIFREEVIPAQRGSILSRNGDPLATSIWRYQVEFDFGSEGLDSVSLFNEQADSLGKLLANYFGDKSAKEYSDWMKREHDKHYRVTYRKDTAVLRSEGWLARWWDRVLDREMVPRKLYDTLRDHRPVTLLPRTVDYSEWQILLRWPLLNWNMGMVYTLVEGDERVYPQGELARRTIGLSGIRGTYGIEHIYKEILSGTPGKTTRQRIARGFYRRVSDDSNVLVVNGLDVVTTLDPDIQEVANNLLQSQLALQNAIWGTTIVMEVATGELIALVNLGKNPDGTYSERENYALGRSTEPGSTFKLASMLLLLEDAGMSPEQRYDTGDGRPMTVGGIKVQDSHGGYREMDFRTAVAQSSNVYFAKAVWERYKDNKERYDAFMRGLHLDRTVGLERFGERTPHFDAFDQVPDPNGMLVRRSFGYRIRLTPIQMATFYNAIANGGKMISPVLVKELRSEGRTVEEFETRTLVERIASEGTLRQVGALLESVGVEGTGRQFFGDTTLYHVAAKTGTAQYADERIKYTDGYYVGSMAAYFPAENPRYTVLTTIFTQRQAGKAYYGGPLAGPVVRDLIRYLYSHNHDWAPAIERPQKRERLQPERVKDTYADNAERKNSVGMGLKDAMFWLESRGYRVTFSGSGEVVRQEEPVNGVVHIVLK